MSFQHEYQELLKWYFAELDRYPETSCEGGFDGERAEKRMSIGNEYRNQLRALKEKYNIPDKEPQPTAPTMSMEEALERFMRGGES